MVAQPHCSRRQNFAGILPRAEAPCRHIEDVAVGSLGRSPGNLRRTPHSMMRSARAVAIGVVGGESYGQTTLPAFEKSLCGWTALTGSSSCISEAVWNGTRTLTARCLRSILDPMYRLEGQNLRGYRWYLRHGLQYLLSCLRLRRCRMIGMSYSTGRDGRLL